MSLIGVLALVKDVAIQIKHSIVLACRRNEEGVTFSAFDLLHNCLSDKLVRIEGLGHVHLGLYFLLIKTLSSLQNLEAT